MGDAARLGIVTARNSRVRAHSQSCALVTAAPLDTEAASRKPSPTQSHEPFIVADERENVEKPRGRVILKTLTLWAHNDRSGWHSGEHLISRKASLIDPAPRKFICRHRHLEPTPRETSLMVVLPHPLTLNSSPWGRSGHIAFFLRHPQTLTFGEHRASGRRSPSKIGRVCRESND
jgi:hypothetical protein